MELIRKLYIATLGRFALSIVEKLEERLQACRLQCTALEAEIKALEKVNRNQRAKLNGIRKRCLQHAKKGISQDILRIVNEK